MYLLDVSIRDLKYFCVLFVLFVFLFMLLALLRCYTSIFDGFISRWRDTVCTVPPSTRSIWSESTSGTTWSLATLAGCLLIKIWFYRLRNFEPFSDWRLSFATLTSPFSLVAFGGNLTLRGVSLCFEEKS